jgi:adenylate kinase
MIILMGVAGSGKSLQGKMFVEDMGYRWISTGELFRSELSEERKRELLTGKILDDNEAISLVEKALGGLKENERPVMDGFPRTIPQAEWIIGQIKNGKLSLRAVFNLIISKDVVEQRLIDRGRADDNETIIKERFHEYETKTVPIIEFFRTNSIKVYDINADQRPEDVHRDMLSYITKA